LELNTISRIEQYLVDALIASPLIPISVNVLRLADAIDNEGVVQQTNNIVVRYTGSTDNVKNRIPMVFERQMQFELNFSTQSYLTSSGHDFATQLLAGAFITLNGSVPSGAYVQVTEPFTCQREQFTGLTEESQYTYSQQYVVTVEEALPYIALDPCVQRGDCRQLFPNHNVEAKMPLGGVLEESTGEIYVPWYSGDKTPGEDYDACYGIRWSNELTQDGDWVFICDPETVFIEKPLEKPIYILTTRSFTEDGRLVVTIFDSETNEPLETVFYCASGKKLARYAIELWRNTIEGSSTNGGVASNAVKDSAWFQGFNAGEYAVVAGGYHFLYTDPLNPDGKQLSLDGGGIIGVQMQTFIQTPKGRFYFVAQSPQGRGWMLEGSFELAELTSLWRLGCLPCSGTSGPVAPC
jgi:hypothetical protein